MYPVAGTLTAYALRRLEKLIIACRSDGVKLWICHYSRKKKFPQVRHHSRIMVAGAPKANKFGKTNNSSLNAVNLGKYESIAVILALRKWSPEQRQQVFPPKSYRRPPLGTHTFQQKNLIKSPVTKSPVYLYCVRCRSNKNRPYSTYSYQGSTYRPLKCWFITMEYFRNLTCIRCLASSPCHARICMHASCICIQYTA